MRNTHTQKPNKSKDLSGYYVLNDQNIPVIGQCKYIQNFNKSLPVKYMRDFQSAIQAKQIKNTMGIFISNINLSKEAKICFMLN